MSFGSASFKLFRRCQGAVGIGHAPHLQYTRLEASDLGASLAGEKLEPIYVAELPGGFATHQGGQITSDGLLVEELSRHLQQPIQTHRHLHSFQLGRRIKKFPGTVFNLVSPCQYNYYHWTLEVLPKLELFRLHGGPASGARYYVETSKPFQLESLRLLGLDPGALINSKEVPTIQASRLIGATIPGPSGVAHPWAVQWLRKSLADGSTPEPAGCLVISRSKAKNRRMVNEDELISTLAPLNPQKIELETCSVSQQINLFRQAKIIIAPHGAGLTNMVFAQTGAHVIELFGGTYRNPCYEKLAAVVGCRYTAVVNRDETDPTNGESHIRLDLEAVAQAALAIRPRPA